MEGNKSNVIGVNTAPKNQIEYLELLEHGTLQSSKRRISDQGLLLIDCASGCYSALRDSIFSAITELERNGKEMSKEQAMLLQAAISCKKHLLNGFIELLRGQSSDSFDNLRKAIEYTLFAAHAFEAPGAALKWLMGAGGLSEFEAYRSEYKIMKMLDPKKYKVLLGEELKLIEHAIEDYEKACIWVHATVISGGPVREDRDGSSGLAFLDCYIDVDQTKLEDIFLWELRAHQNVLEILYALLKRSGLDVKNTITWSNTIGILKTSIRRNAEQILVDRTRKNVNQNDIAQRAYFRWIERGGEDGNDLEDWFVAEEAIVTEMLHTRRETANAT